MNENLALLWKEDGMKFRFNHILIRNVEKNTYSHFFKCGVAICWLSIG